MAKILVIDDNTELLEMVNLLLEKRGEHETVLSADSADGLAKALADPPDLAILDVMMPGISGYEICRRLRAHPPTASIPIIILTARGQPVDRQAALDAGADAYLAKPVQMTELLEQVNTLLTKHAAVKPSLFTGTIVLLSLRGGVGVTTLAVNLAATLAQTRSAVTCLVDLCPSSGHVALQLGLRPEPNWSGLIQAGVPNAETIETHLLQHPSGLRVLASPVVPVVGQELSPTVIPTTIRTLQQRFAVTVVDAPPVLNEVTLAALEAATVVGLVLTAETPSIQSTIGTLRALQQWSDKCQLILNKVRPGSQLPAGAIERTLRHPLIQTIPFDPAQAQALTQSTPQALHNPGSPLAQAVRGLVQELARVVQSMGQRGS